MIGRKAAAYGVLLVLCLGFPVACRKAPALFIERLFVAGGGGSPSVVRLRTREILIAEEPNARQLVLVDLKTRDVTIHRGLVGKAAIDPGGLHAAFWSESGAPRLRVLSNAEASWELPVGLEIPSSAPNRFWNSLVWDPKSERVLSVIFNRESSTMRAMVFDRELNLVDSLDLDAAPSSLLGLGWLGSSRSWYLVSGGSGEIIRWDPAGRSRVGTAPPDSRIVAAYLDSTGEAAVVLFDRGKKGSFADESPNSVQLFDVGIVSRDTFRLVASDVFVPNVVYQQSTSRIWLPTLGQDGMLRVLVFGESAREAAHVFSAPFSRRLVAATISPVGKRIAFFELEPHSSQFQSPGDGAVRSVFKLVSYDFSVSPPSKREARRVFSFGWTISGSCVSIGPGGLEFFE